MKTKVICLFALFFLLFLSSCTKDSKITITFDSNGADSVESIVYDGSGEFTIPEAPFKDGYIFDGWYIDNGTFLIKFTENFLIDKPSDDDFTVYANWKLQNNTITFDTNGGTSIAPLSVEAGATIIAPTNPVRKDFIFAGWYMDLDSVESYAFSIMPSSSIILYADWATKDLIYTLIDDDSAYEVSVPQLPGLVNLQIPKKHQGKIITKIANSGFSGLNGLKDIIIPNTVVSIGGNAFMGCEELVQINISEFITEIGEAPFFRCGNLKSINVDLNNQNYKSIDGVLFSKSGDQLINYPAGRIENSYTINSDVVIIGAYAFGFSINISEIIIGDGVTTIKSHAFYECWNLESIIIPDNVTTVEMYIFRNCVFLNEVTLGTGLTELSAYMFNRCIRLHSIILPENIEYIGYGAFYDCTELNSVYINKKSEDGLITGALFMFAETPSYLVIYVPDVKTKDEYKSAYFWTSYASKIQVNPE